MEISDHKNRIIGKKYSNTLYDWLTSYTPEPISWF